MPKNRTKFVCDRCGAESLKWMGRCPECGEWNTLVEMTEPASTSRSIASRASASPVSLQEVPIQGMDRIRVPIGELDRVLGGGIVPGSLVLVGGD
ncbi:MAG: DNA repair protein RadA, partial [Actinobacteria bacterium]|nr:DNA repair protein RadA [Actinomycetota bacterium]